MSSPTDDDIVFFMPVSLAEQGTAGRPNHALLFLRFNKDSSEWNTGGFSNLLVRGVNESGRDLGNFLEVLARPESMKGAKSAREEEPQLSSTLRLRFLTRIFKVGEVGWGSLEFDGHELGFSHPSDAFGRG